MSVVTGREMFCKVLVSILSSQQINWGNQHRIRHVFEWTRYDPLKGPTRPKKAPERLVGRFLAFSGLE